MFFTPDVLPLPLTAMIRTWINAWLSLGPNEALVSIVDQDLLNKYKMILSLVFALEQ